MKDNFNYIKDKFDNDNISAPDSLNDENIKSLLENGAEPKNNIKLKSSRPYQAILAMVACFAVLIISLTSVNAFKDKNLVKQNNSAISIADSALITYNDYSEIEKQIKKLEKNRNLIFDFEGLTMKGEANIDDVATDSASINHSETNIQVDGVDEADIVKTDGKYIYRFNMDYNAVLIFEVNGDKVNKVGKIALEDKYDYVSVSDMYLVNDKLVLIGYYDQYNEKNETTSNATTINVYNLKNKSNPALEYSYEQSGYYSTSRMVGGVVYLVSNYYADRGAYIPRVNNQEIKCDCIYGMPNFNEPNFVVVGAVDIDNHSSNKVKTKAILGGSSNVFCSTENLYITSQKYNFDETTDVEGYVNVFDDASSDIIKISLDKTNLNIVATANINGWINNQYSMNEKDNYFFVAATTKTKNNKDINTLYVLDSKLNKISQVDSFAKNESIKAVRYIGDYAYVITYEQTDPLFVVDLSDVQNPQIKGSVKIDGFSTSLIPVDENTLLGVGNNVDDLVEDGIKFVLFDISNPEKPRVLNEIEMPETYSPAQYDIKAITLFDNNAAVPIYNYNNDQAAVIIEINGKKLNLKKSFNSSETFSRLVQINDYIYGSTEATDDILPFKM